VTDNIIALQAKINVPGTLLKKKQNMVCRYRYLLKTVQHTLTYELLALNISFKLWPEIYTCPESTIRLYWAKTRSQAITDKHCLSVVQFPYDSTASIAIHSS